MFISLLGALKSVPIRQCAVDTSLAQRFFALFVKTRAAEHRVAKRADPKWSYHNAGFVQDLLRSDRTESWHSDQFKRWPQNQPLCVLDAQTVEVLRSDISSANFKSTNWWPSKPKTASVTKCNLFFDDVLASLKKHNPNYAAYIMSQAPGLIGLTADQLVCYTMFHHILWRRRIYVQLLDLVETFIDVETSKCFSNLVKQLGPCLSEDFALFAEINCLHGRGSIPFDVDKEFADMSHEPSPPGDDVRFAPGVVYDAVFALCRKSMPAIAFTAPNNRYHTFFPTKDDYWARRLILCVNGAHHAPPNSGLPDVQHGIERNRMAFLEATEANILFTTVPGIYASFSQKDDNPAKRPLKAGDTASYLNEDYLMKVVERHWESESVLLSPGLSSKLDEVLRVRTMRGKRRVNLDFTRFEQQHSLRSQTELTAALCDFLGVPTDIREWFIAAQNNQWLARMGETVRVKYGLLTGRRMTTFINTILNFVYIDLALGDAVHLLTGRLHAGDDVTLGVETDADARTVIDKALASKSTFNPGKQSWGECSEFLRHSIGPQASFGYVCRSISTFVSGSWLNELKLSGSDILSVFSRYCWTISNRCMDAGAVADLCSVSLAKQANIREQDARMICANSASVNGSPVVPTFRAIPLVRASTEVQSEPTPPSAPSFATDAYIKTVAADALRVTDEDGLRRVRDGFRNASYRKGLITGFETKTTKWALVPVHCQPVAVTDAQLRPEARVASSVHPMMGHLRAVLSQHDLECAAMLLGAHARQPGQDFNEWLTGVGALPVSCPMGSNYDDMLQLGVNRFLVGYDSAVQVTNRWHVYY